MNHVQQAQNDFGFGYCEEITEGAMEEIVFAGRRVVRCVLQTIVPALVKSGVAEIQRKNAGDCAPYLHTLKAIDPAAETICEAINKMVLIYGDFFRGSDILQRDWARRKFSPQAAEEQRKRVAELQSQLKESQDALELEEKNLRSAQSSRDAAQYTRDDLRRRVWETRTEGLREK